MSTGDRERSDEELARTETAPGSEPRAGDAVPLGDQLGRYRLQREIGRGGMGVVHAAFDPDLERKVALKVLKGDEDEQARQRLLREARAMARVTHPNVVTVHEVGSVGGRDYIAMELIDGVTLDEWLGQQKRSERDIIHAFLAAGRGLAAAHAVGLVHRDFKPRNVLRHKDGRIVVTDFGLVVGVGDPSLSASRVNMRAAPGEDTPSSLSGLTATGSVLGTPAYMAPEQWKGTTIGPAADQFSFCVALWEALTGERPYQGKTLEALQEEVCTAKRTDDSKLPRRLRKIIARGLEPDPAKRYPSMDALLTAITRAERRPGVALALGGGALFVAIGVFLVVARGSSAPSCAVPAVDPNAAWNSKDAAALRQQHRDLAADTLDRDMREWLQARASACQAPAASREPALACLDGVIVRFQAVKRAMLALKDAPNTDVGTLLLEPKICESPRPPRLSRATTKELDAVLQRYLRKAPAGRLTEADADAILAEGGLEPCASAFAHLYAAGIRVGLAREREITEADRAAQRCGDDRLIADVAMFDAKIAMAIAAPDTRAKIKTAEALIERVSQADIEAELETTRATLAMQLESVDEGIKRMEHAIALFEGRGMVRNAITGRLQLLRFKQLRAHPEDLAAITPTLAEIRKTAAEKLGESDDLVGTIDWMTTNWLWTSGQIEAADRMKQQIVKLRPPEKPRVVRGIVVDETGAPVSGVDVYVSPSISGDSLFAAMPDPDVRSTKTAADGRFQVSDAESECFAVAQLGDKRSSPTQVTGDDVQLVLKPTSRVSGKVELHGQPATSVTIVAIDRDVPMAVTYSLAAPVQPDGTFSIAGVPRGHIHFQTMTQRLTSQLVSSKDLVVDKPEITGVQLEVKYGKRSLSVLVRSSYGMALSNAQIFVMAGKHPAVSDLKSMISALDNASTKLAMPMQAEQASPRVHEKSKPNDLYALVTEVPEGEASACSFPLPQRLDDPELQEAMQKPENLAKIPVTCVPVSATDEIVVISVQPWPRFD